MSNTVQTIETVTKQYGTGGDLYGGFVNLQNAQQPDLSVAEKTQATIDASVNFLKVVEALGSLFKEMPGKFGGTLNTVSFFSNLTKAQNQMGNKGPGNLPLTRKFNFIYQE